MAMTSISNLRAPSTLRRRSTADLLAEALARTRLAQPSRDKLVGYSAKPSAATSRLTQPTYSTSQKTQQRLQQAQPSRAALTGTSAPSTRPPASTQTALQTSSTQSKANAAAAATGGMQNPSTTTPAGASSATGGGTSGFAKSFTPDSHQMMFTNPDALIRAYYDFMKYDTGGGELAMSQGQNAENLLLMHTLFGGGGDLRNPQNAQFGPYADFAGGYLQNARTPGGKYYGADAIVDALGTNNTNSQIYHNLYDDSLTPDQQAGNYIYAYSTAASPSTSREAMSAQIAYLSTLEQKFIAEKAQGKHAGVNFGEYLAANGWG